MDMKEKGKNYNNVLLEMSSIFMDFCLTNEECYIVCEIFKSNLMKNSLESIKEHKESEMFKE